MRINDDEVLMQGPCLGNTSCTFSQFIELAKNVSFHGDDAGYQSWCKNPLIDAKPPKIELKKIYLKAAPEVDAPQNPPSVGI
jgi:hypothetical protein